MISALNNSFGASAPYTDQTFDLAQLISSASKSDPANAKSYDAGIALIDKINDHWAKIKTGSSAAGNATGVVTTTVNPDGTTTTSSTSATYTT